MPPDSPNGRVNVPWTEPKCNCSNQCINRPTVEPNIKPGASFGVGNHVIRYSYDLSNGVNVQCSVNLTVRGNFTVLYLFLSYSYGSGNVKAIKRKKTKLQFFKSV